LHLLVDGLPEVLYSVCEARVNRSKPLARLEVHFGGAGLEDQHVPAVPQSGHVIVGLHPSFTECAASALQAHRTVGVPTRCLHAGGVEPRYPGEGRVDGDRIVLAFVQLVRQGADGAGSSLGGSSPRYSWRWHTR
jgi:hypothetical protein